MKQKVNKELGYTIAVSLILASIITIVKLCSKNFYLKTFTIPLACLLIGFLFLVFYLNKSKQKKAYLYLIPIILIFISDFVIPIDISNKVLNACILPLLLSIFFISVTNKNYETNRYFWSSIFKLFPNNFVNNIKELNFFKPKEKKINTSKIANICIGCIIGVPIALVILSLLTSADQYFDSFLEEILTFFHSTDKWETLLKHFLTLLCYFVIIFSIYQNTIKPQKEEKTQKVITKEINETIIKTILSIINFVFVLFLISEISKLTFNFLKLPTEYTYARYAREGFFQLLFVTLINFIVIVYILYYTNAIQKSKSIKKLLFLLISFSIILIFNSYYRMFLYIYEYGFTVLRLQVILFLFMELLLFLIFIKKIGFQLKHKDNILFTSIILTFYILNLYLCIDPFIEILNTIF